MPSNKQLAAEAHELAEQLGIEVDTQGLNNQKLADLVSDLKAKKADAEHHTQADEEPKAEAEPEPVKAVESVEVKLPPFIVKQGVSITSKRGILADGAEVSAEDLGGGEKDLHSLVKSGHVIDNR